MTSVIAPPDRRSDAVPTARPGLKVIFHDDFETLSDQQLRFLPAGQSVFDDEHREASFDGGNLNSAPRLSADGEFFLFRKMNYLKWQASRFPECAAEQADEEELEDLLEDANAIRNQIAESNIGLVRALARKFSLSAEHFEELQSEGFEILLKSIALFDCSRGYRFSTYATHAVQRHFYRIVRKQSRRSATEMKTDSEILCQLPAGETDADIAEWITHEQKLTELIATMGDHLEERERQIVADRFGLNPGGVVKSLRQLGEELGVSKERARQLQISAIGKLRVLFQEISQASLSQASA